MGSLKTSVLASIVAVSLGSAAVGEVLVGYDMDDLASNGSAPATAVSSTIATAADVTRGSAVASSSAAESFTGVPSNVPDSTATALTAGNYYEFSFTVGSDAVSLSGIESVIRTSSGAAGSTLQYVYSLDGFSTFGDAGAAFTVVRNSPSGSEATAQPTVDLTGVGGLQNIAPGTTVEFRMAISDKGTSGSTLGYGGLGGPEGDDLAVTGEVVPEPGSLALVSLGGLTMLRRRSQRMD